MSEYKLTMTGIRKTFGALVANDHIDLAVRGGTIHAIIGENGAGKSTLMSILSGVQRPDSGVIALDGKAVEIRDPMDAVAHGIGMVYQEFMQYPGLSVLDNIIMGYEQNRGLLIDRRRIRKKLEEICRDYGMSIPLDSRLEKLPVAMLQQVEIIKVLYRSAEILILDEPTSVLTPQGVEGLFQALRNLRAMGKTVIIITHKLKEVMEIADDITVLKNGKVTGRLPKAEADENLLARLMVGRDVMLQAEKLPCTPGAELLRVEDLSVRDAKGVERVKKASLRICAGEIVGICGIAGSGESELVAAIMGLTDVEKGSSIRLNGEEICGKTVAERRMRGIGYVPQDRNRMGVNRRGAIWETAFMGHHIASGVYRKPLIDRKESQDFTNYVVKDFSVKAQNINDRVSSLSGGNVQKLVVGREFSDNYKLMIMEDPTRGIDIGAIEFIWKRIIRYAAEGAGVLLVSHELNEVMQLSDRICVMHNGELTELENGTEMTEKEIGLYMLGGVQSEQAYETV